MICYHSQPQFEEKKVTDLTIEEKLAHLQTAAMEEARAEGSAIIPVSYTHRLASELR